MIKFPCLCHYNFAVDDDMAGREIQCPKCGRLNDVPTAEQLKALRSDGTIQVDITPETTEAGRVEHLIRAFSRDRVDADGVDIDLRNTPEEIAKAGVTDEGFALVDDHARPAKPAAPKYDPVTGELIRPIEFKEDQDPIPADQIPMASPTLAYARPDLKSETSSWRPISALLRPLNLFVMFFVLLGHFILILLLIPIAFGVYFATPLLAVVVFGIFAHYANVIEEIGPEDRDELPRLMRHMSFTDDFWNPSIRIVMALTYCFLPAALVFQYVPGPTMNNALAIILASLGAILFPAVLLTTATSGAVECLRPDRVIGVITTIGVRYLMIFGLFLAAGSLYTLGIIGTSPIRFSSLMWLQTSILSNAAVGLTLLVLGIYTTHAFAWYLGLLYRTHHEHFPWAHQRHIRTTPRENVAMHAAKTAVRAAERDARRSLLRRSL